MAKTSIQNNLTNPGTGRILITKAFGENLTILLAEKISTVHKKFDSKGFIRDTKKAVVGKSSTQRIEVIANWSKSKNEHTKWILTHAQR